MISATWGLRLQIRADEHAGPRHEINDLSHKSFINMASCTLMSITPSVQLYRKHRPPSSLFMLCQCGILQKIVRLALSWRVALSSPSYSSWLLLSSLLRLSRCQGSSVIYWGFHADKHSNSAAAVPTSSNIQTRTQTHASSLAHILPRFWLRIRAKQKLLWARPFVWFLIIVFFQHPFLLFPLLLPCYCSPWSCYSC